MTIPKLRLLLRDARIQPAVNEMELHPHFQQPELFDFVRANGIEPVGYCPVGSPNRPERDRTPDDTVDIEDPVIVQDRGTPGRASGGGVHQVGRAARADSHSALDQARAITWRICEASMGDPLTGDEMRADRRHRPQLPPDQGPGLPVARGADVGGSLGPATE